jgi:glycosyltransferase involved in cell wall biosynthesis
LLEAMGSGNIIICHDNIFNHEVTGNDQFYFKDAKGVANCINLVESISVENKINLKNKSISRIQSYYNWDNMLEKYSRLFRNCIDNNNSA